MPSFTLTLNKKNFEIAKAIEGTNAGYVRVDVEIDKVRVSFSQGLNIGRLELGEVGGDLSISDWNALCKEVKSTLEGAKVREFNNLLIGIHPLKTKHVHIRLDPIDEALLRDAARVEEKTITDFVRTAALKMANEVFEREAVKEAQRRTKEKTYVS